MESGEYLGEISALCFLHLPPPCLPYLLAGTGSQLLFYDLRTGNIISSFQVFKGIRVHGISCLPNSTNTESLTFKVAVFGERRLKLLLFNIQLPHNLIHLQSSQSLPHFSHWILDVCFIQDCLIAIGCTNNSVCFWNTFTSTITYEVTSPDKCLLYTMRMWGDRIDSLLVASGTIFNQILVWKVVCAKESGKYEGVLVCRLDGHEGSIFRITWSLDGSKLVSVSDDRSARIWEVGNNAATVLFGHTARVWDCCMSESDSLIITVGEDCTCRLWGLDGTQLRVIKEHIGRGVWRCLYDSRSSLVVTAGFDSAIKVHQLHSSLERQLFTIQIPNSKPTSLMDSKSEYVRCMHFASEDALYVATNNGLLYLGKICGEDVVWTKLFHEEIPNPIVCMSVLEKWIALGDGKGRLTVVRDRVEEDNDNDNDNLSFTWQAEPQRQLLETFWCKSLGHRYVFTADPRGRLKLWNICKNNASLVAEFTSCFPTRIICLDASFQEKVLVCGDLRGNLVLFPLLRDGNQMITPLDHFKGAHGISTVSSVSIYGSNSSNVEIHSSGGDGCICYMEYDRCKKRMEFMGMKQVKELSLVESLLNDKYAIGFASADFIIWNLSTQTKVAQIPCGGWRRPHAYIVGDIPEMQNCFAFVKDEVIHIHKHRVPTSDRNRILYPQNLHLQFHGREMHSLCFITDENMMIATGCEDGSVRLTRYYDDKWSASKLLGEHVGGSAVRSLCCVDKKYYHTIIDEEDEDEDEEDDEFLLLISVGAKRVLTAWKRINNQSSSFQWLSSDFPTRTRHNENDWRYLAVTAFLVNISSSKTCVCFVVVACSDGTVTLRGLVLPHRLWFDIGVLVPSASPVLSLQHVTSIKDKRRVFMVISGSTDGSIGFWDVSQSVKRFMRKVSTCTIEDCSLQRRPRTGRGSQGGRQLEEEKEKEIEIEIEIKIEKISPLHVMKNVHQSGVNCLHVSSKDKDKDCESWIVISGGDDQALHCISFCFHHQQQQLQLQLQLGIVFDKIASAHSSAVKGVWTDGKWGFSCGLDQRVRCWHVSGDGKLTEHSHLILSVPEPEALDVTLCGRNRYQIAVAGRGMQMLQFLAP